MFGREPNFLHVVELLRLPGEAIILPLLGKGEREAAPTSAPQGLKVKDWDKKGPIWLSKATAFPQWLLYPENVSHKTLSPLIYIAKPRYYIRMYILKGENKSCRV